MQYGLSMRQPWATLLAYGRKSVEVRRWPTRVRGRVLIHAARLPDERPEAWDLVSPDLRTVAAQSGGVVGEAFLDECLAYRTPEQFAADRTRHLNPAAWFVPPVMYGFVFSRPQILAFRPYSGQTRFFRVVNESWAAAATPGLLVSVRSAAEAKAALGGGADVIDVKEPADGPLGRAPDRTIAAVVRTVAGRRPVSAALGELRSAGPLPAIDGLSFVKLGLAGCRAVDWRARLEAAEASVAPGVAVVAVAYADWRQADAPSPDEVCAFAVARPGRVLLVDTFQKAKAKSDAALPPTTLLDHLPLQKLSLYCRLCRSGGVRIALAGNLDASCIARLAALAPDWIAVRGAACRGGRAGPVDAQKVRELAALLNPRVEHPRPES
jgi:uncharacterized protein (UPF0264 family)